MKKLIAALGALAVLASLPSSPAGAGDVVRASGSGVTVVGDPSDGSSLTARPGGWTPQPDTRRYEWLRDGEDAVLSRAATYTVVPDDIGHTIVVIERIAVGTQLNESSYETPVVTASSGVVAQPPAAAAPAVRTPAVNTKRPSIKGTTKVGKRLSIRSKGTWRAAGHTYRYQWLRNGTKISGATKTRYKLVKKDRRTKISVRVYAKRSGYPTVSATSARTGRVR
ncbi:MAG: hypothetical protein ABW075_09500 [Aeromicrobium sp.]